MLPALPSGGRSVILAEVAAGHAGGRGCSQAGVNQVRRRNRHHGGGSYLLTNSLIIAEEEDSILEDRAAD